MNILKIAFLILILSVSLAQAQEKKIRFTHITTENGLSNNAVNSIIQDKYGFMWLGTDNGLNRYDGKNVMAFRNDSTNKNSINSNKIRVLLRDSKDRIWVGTDVGLNLFDPVTNKFTRYQHDSTNLSSIAAGKVKYLYEDKLGRIWISTGCLNYLDTKTGKFTRFCHDTNNPFSPHRTSNGVVIQDDAHKFWVGTWADEMGVDTFRFETGKFDHLPFKGRDKRVGNLSPELVNIIFEDRNKNLWFGCYTGLYYYDWQTKLFTYYHYYDPANYFCSQITSINEDNYGNIWIGTYGNGLFIFDPRCHKFYYYQHNPENINSIVNNEISAIYKDKTGTMWIATSEGVSVVDVFSNQFGWLQYTDDKPKAPVVGTFAMIEDHFGNLWTDFHFGAAQSEPKHCVVFDNQKQSFQPPQLFDAQSNIEGFTNHKNELYVCIGNSIYVTGQNKQTSLIQRINFPLAIYSLAFDRRNPDVFWSINTLGSLTLNDVNTGLPIKEYISGDTAAKIPTTVNGRNLQKKRIDLHTVSHQIKSIYIDSKNNLWALHQSPNNENCGLLYFDKASEKFEKIRPDVLNMVFSVYETKKGELLIGCESGLYTYDQLTDKLSPVSLALPADSVGNITEDRQGNIWFTHNYGIRRFNPQTNISDVFYCKTDIPFVNRIIIQLRNSVDFGEVSGQIYIRNLEGILYFNPEQIIFNSQPPPVYITDFKLFDQSITFDTAAYTKKRIVLEYDQNFFTIHFAALNYSFSQDNIYKYKLEDIDNDWINTTEAEAKYTSVPSGKYIFKVMGCNNKGIWNETPTTIEIVIKPPLWLTWWAYIVYVILAIGVVYGIVKWQIKRLEKEKLRLENIVEERTAELKESNNELHIQKEEILTQKEEILAQAELLQETNDKLVQLDQFKEGMTGMIVHDLKNPLGVIINSTFDSNIKQAGKQMLTMVMNILDVQKFEDAKMKIQPTDFLLNKCLSEALQQVKTLYERKSISIENTISNEIAVKGDNELINRVFVNLLTNAIKYSNNNGKITVNSEKCIVKSEKFVKVFVTDSGQGIPADKIYWVFEKFGQIEAKKSGGIRSTGLGLTFCKLAVEAHGGKIGVESEEGNGTTFWFTLPKGETQIIEIQHEQEVITPEKNDVLSQEDKTYLMIFTKELARFSVFEYTDVNSILKRIEAKNQAIEQWKKDVRKALRACNQERYEELITVCL